jgi:hypothetical protein
VPVTYGFGDRFRRWARLPDDRIAAAAGAAAIRFSLLRMALRRRDDIPELVVLALEQVRDQEHAQAANHRG